MVWSIKRKEMSYVKNVKYNRYVSIINACKKFIKKNYKNKFLIIHYRMTLGEYKYYRRVSHINRDMGIVVLLNITKGNELYEESKV